ncbi:ABC transporter ATP-binding protein [filamentous cyanobacterium LEGE 11480]|uniref:ABC transporter ATP-binding protein n=2 Tax=Romeriopsis TaxID=2992131 RepID=A0A928VGK2_9CYAN|nr:ABC transporter ATP-binding protein [Romeriopsis navalis LEGE 11480]
MIEYLSRFLYVLAASRKKLIILVCGAVIAAFVEAIGIGMVGPFIALVTNPKFAEQYPFVLDFFRIIGLGQLVEEEPQLILPIFGVAVVIVTYLKSYLSFCVQRYIFKFSYAQRGKLFGRLLHTYSRAPYTFHLTHNSSELIQKMVNETEQFTTTVVMPQLFIISNACVIGAIILLLVIVNSLAMLVVCGMFLVAFGLLQHFKQRIARWGRDKTESFEASIRIINHALGGIKEVRVLGCESYFETQAQVQTQRYATSTASFIAFNNLPRYALEAFMVTFLVAFTFIYLKMNPNNAESLSSVLGIFALASVRMLPALITLVGSISNVRYAKYSLDNMYRDLKELEKLSPELMAAEHRASNDRLQGQLTTLPFTQSISLDQITYRYDSSADPSLDGVALTLNRGESIGIIGRSGAGKTTLIDVILGLLTPSDGDITVDGQSIYQDLRSWQNMVGYVPQNIFLIDDTLARNIAFGVPDHLIDHERLQKAITAAQLDDLVERLPEGLNTVLGERGTRLSGGQRQRVGIARIIYHDREVLVLDEATSALDNATELLVSDAVKALGGHKTLIIIAHRLSTIEHCDRIYMMEKGRVVKSGTYEEVVLGTTPEMAMSDGTN